MKYKFLIILIMIFIPSLNAMYITYDGAIANSKITLVLDAPDFTDQSVKGFYFYNKYHTPIQLSGKYENGKLSLYEKNSNKELIASLLFENYLSSKSTIHGKWQSADNNKSFQVLLNERQRFSPYKNYTDNFDIELLQASSLEKYYFTLGVGKGVESYYPRVKEIRLYYKQSGKLSQKFEIDTEFWGINTVEVGDFNFDGYADFSVFEASYSGPNTSSLYFVYDPNKHRYFLSDISGVSLEFDQKSKTITSRNSSQAGRSITSDTFKITNNKMIMISSECLTYDDEKDDFISCEK